MNAKPRMVVGLSGGIDSAEAAGRLLAGGFEVVGVTLRLRACTSAEGERRSCCGLDVAGAAGAVAADLGIRHYVVDCHDRFADEVLRRCWSDLARGRTPNPCVLCNALVRFPVLLEWADALGAEGAATGHYARLERMAAGGCALRRGLDASKDQSYFLHAVADAALRRMRLPLGTLRKTDVRAGLRGRGAANAERPESQDVCFTDASGSFAEYLRMRFGGEARPGVLRTPDGREVGRHAGIHHFTIGQRRGLGVALGAPARVCAIDPETGDVVISTDPADGLSSGCRAVGCRWLTTPPIAGAVFQAQVRYRQQPLRTVVTAVEDGGRAIEVRFEAPVAAVTPGQFLVLYEGDRVLGGGPIDAALPASAGSAASCDAMS